MKNMLLTLLVVATLAGSLTNASAQDRVTVSCYRGPLPHSPIINGANDRFVKSLYRAYDMTMDQARTIADEVCADMGAVHNYDRLIALTKAALKDFRPR